MIIFFYNFCSALLLFFRRLGFLLGPYCGALLAIGWCVVTVRASSSIFSCNVFDMGLIPDLSDRMVWNARFGDTNSLIVKFFVFDMG